jgi:hypothetical protein
MFRFASAATALRYFSDQSSPVRVSSCTRPLSKRAAMRKPSSLISCSHWGPDGGFSTSCESCGGMNRGRGTPWRDGVDLTACEAERLTKRDMLELNSKGTLDRQREEARRGSSCPLRRPNRVEQGVAASGELQRRDLEAGDRQRQPVARLVQRVPQL